MAENPASRPAMLLLEDDTSLADLVVAHLEADFEIERAANAEEAEMLLATRKFDLLLCDHMLPGGKQGLDFLVEARERYPEARRVLLTGYMNPDLISRSIAVAGLGACLMKPLRMESLREQLQAVMAKPA
jgi:two-component system, NtrC family, response regulator HupR/HoxA